MISKSGLTVNKRICLSFVNKFLLLVVCGLLLLVISSCSYLLYVYWFDFPLIVKILGPITLAAILIGIAFTPFNGMVITQKGTILFLPDLRIKKASLEELDRVAIIFNECDNGKYSVTVKMVYKSGRVFVKDYSKQFNDLKHKRLPMSVYTINKQKVDKILAKLSALNAFYTTVVDKNRQIVYQNKH